MKINWIYFNNYFIILIIIITIIILLIPSYLKNIHPLFIGRILLLYSILITSNLNLFNKNHLYSIITYLIIVGGLLILFLYFNRFAINNKIIFNNNIILIYFYKIILIIIIIILFIYKLNLINLFLFVNNSIIEINPLINNIKTNNNNIKLIYLKFNILTIFRIIYLLYSLIIIVKLIFSSKPKSLRKLLSKYNL